MAQVANPRFEIENTQEGFTAYLRGYLLDTGAEFEKKLADAVETQAKALNIVEKEAKVFPNLPVTIKPMEILDTED